MVEIRETSDYEALVPLFIRNELEFSEEDETPTDIVKCWAANETEGTEGGELVGGCVLALRDGQYIIDGIALEAPYRKKSLGKALLGRAIDEAKARGAGELYLVARAPEFFRKQGFETVAREDAPNFFECATCPQYNVSCFPEVMKLKI